MCREMLKGDARYSHVPFVLSVWFTPWTLYTHGSGLSTPWTLYFYTHSPVPCTVHDGASDVLVCVCVKRLLTTETSVDMYIFH